MDREFLSKTEQQEWTNRRISEVNKFYSAYNALVEKGIELLDESTSLQILCPFHDDKNKPSARYYAASGNKASHFYCFKCKDRLDGIALHSRFNSNKYYESLSALEKRFGIKVPKKPDNVHIPLVERTAGYKSSAWNDVPRFLEILENKLIRNRHKATLPEYIKVNRMMDAIRWDHNVTGSSTPEMISSLEKASRFIDSFFVVEELL